jgi:two-component system OmpR family response regulator
LTRILVIEDDPETAAFICSGLRQEGFAVDHAATGSDGLFQATESPPELIVVDRMLPGLDGVSVVRALRAAGVSVPVLFLTAIGAVEDRVAGLEAGGDDYLVKPFSFMELRARIQTLLRRPPLKDEVTSLEAQGVKVDRLTRRVLSAQGPIDLQPREYQLLEYLLQHRDNVVTRTMLLEAIWGFHFDPGTNIVETHLSRLRSKLSAAGAPPLIRTVRGAGYVIDAN